MTDFTLLIPVYNPTEHFGNLLKNIEKVVQATPYRWHIVVVNDGSRHWYEMPQLNIPLTVLRHSCNKGKGAALKTGFQYVLTQQPLTRAVITMDGDWQHLPRNIPTFVRRFNASKADMVLGVRPRDWRTMPIHRIASNFLTSLIISTLIGQKVPDSQSGFRLIQTNTLRKLFNRLKENRFHLESEMIIHLGWMKGTIQTVPIPTIYNGAPSAIKNWPDTLNFIALIARLVMQRMWGNV